MRWIGPPPPDWLALRWLLVVRIYFQFDFGSHSLSCRFHSTTIEIWREMQSAGRESHDYYYHRAVAVAAATVHSASGLWIIQLVDVDSHSDRSPEKYESIHPALCCWGIKTTKHWITNYIRRQTHTDTHTQTCFKEPVSVLLRQSFCSYFPPTPGGKWRNRQKSVGSYFFEIFPFVLGALCLMTAAPIVPHVAQLIKNRFFNPELKKKKKKKWAQSSCPPSVHLKPKTPTYDKTGFGLRQRNKQKKLLPPRQLFGRRPDGHKEPKRLSLSSWMKWLLKEEEGRRRKEGGLNYITGGAPWRAGWCARVATYPSISSSSSSPTHKHKRR